MRAILYQVESDERRVTKVQRRHRGNRELEFVLRPRGPASVIMQHVHEPVPLGKHSRRHASPNGDDDESDDIFKAKGTSDVFVLSAGDEGVAVNIEGYSQHDVGVVYHAKSIHQPRNSKKDVPLQGSFKVDVKEILDREELGTMKLRFLKDGCVSANRRRRDCSQSLIYLEPSR